MTHKAYALQAFQAIELNEAGQEQSEAQAELESHLEQQVQAIAPEIFRTVEISFYDHEVYAGSQLIASITHDHDDFVTQRWIVIVNNVEIHRANTWAKCYRYITWHYKQGTLPRQRQETEPATTTNETSYPIAAECEKFGFELYDDGIYYNDVKLGEVGCTDGRWWVVRASSEHQLQIPCNSVHDAVWSLWITKVSHEPTQSVSKTNNCEQLLDQPFDQLIENEWEQLKKYKPLPSTAVLAA